jgi:hypothetical protein
MGVYPYFMPLATGAIAIDSGGVLVLIALVAIPFAAFSFSRVGEVYRSIGKGPMAIDQDLPPPRYAKGPEPAVDQAVQRAEVRQMLEAKANRLQARGEAPIDIEAEAERLLAPPPMPPGAGAGEEDELRAEVRQLVVSRNERRLRQGLESLDVEAETSRQLADFIGSD